jgi:hypothetical protein
MFRLGGTWVKPIVQIHCWGGLGSQFHAWHLLELLKLRHPRRKFQLVFHTAGFTKRLPEIEEFLSLNEIRKINDYHPKNPSGKGLRSNNSGPTKKIKSWVKFFLSQTGIENNQESLESLIRIYPWTRIIRGHYSRISINDAALMRISSKIFSPMENQPGKNLGTLVVHLRLGDLRDLAHKAPIHADSLRQVVSEILVDVKIQQTVVHSDSPEIVRTFLGSSVRTKLMIRDLSVTSLSALVEMVDAEYFVGTSSKLSLWTSIFRLKLGKVNTYIPRHLSPALFDLLGQEAKGIHFYD